MTILHAKYAPTCSGSLCDSAGGHRGKRFARDNVGVTCKKCLKKIAKWMGQRAEVGNYGPGVQS